MGKKRKIREEFDAIFRSGNEKKIKEMLDKFPWLLSEVSSEMDEIIVEQGQVIAALGVMEDDLGGAVPIYEIAQCLKEDFNINKPEEIIKQILDEALNLNLVKIQPDGWALTSQGEKMCDIYLNKTVTKNLDIHGHP